MPQFIRDIIPPRAKRAGRSILTSARRAQTRIEEQVRQAHRERKESFAHAVKRFALFLFRAEPLAVLLVLLLFVLFNRSIFTQATVNRTHATRCEGSFVSPQNAQGAPEVKPDGSVFDFNDQNSAFFPGGSKDISCDGFSRPEEDFTKAHITFVLGVRKKQGAPAPLPTSDVMRPTTSATNNEQQTPNDTSPSSEPAASLPIVFPTLPEEQSLESETSPSPSDISVPSETIIPEPTPQASDAAEPTPEETPQSSDTVEPEPPVPSISEGSPVSKFFRFFESIFYPAYAQEEAAPSDSSSPGQAPLTGNTESLPAQSSPGELSPSPSDVIQETPQASQTIQAPQTETSPTISPTETSEANIILPNIDGELPVPSDVIQETLQKIQTETGSIEAPEETPVPSPTPSPIPTESTEPQLILPGLDEGLEEESPDSQLQDFSFVDFVARIQYAVGDSQWKTLEEITKISNTQYQISNETQRPSESLAPSPSDTILPSPSDTIAPTPSDTLLSSPEASVLLEASPTLSIEASAEPAPSGTPEEPATTRIRLTPEITPEPEARPLPLDSSEPIPETSPVAPLGTSLLRRFLFQNAIAQDQEGANARIYYTYDLPKTFTADDLEILKARLDVLAVEDANVEIYLDSVYIETETEENILQSALPASEESQEEEQAPQRGTVVAKLPKSDLKFHDRQNDPNPSTPLRARSRYRFSSEHDGIRIEVAEKGNEKVGFRIEDTNSKKWLKFELEKFPQTPLEIRPPSASAVPVDRNGSLTGQTSSSISPYEDVYHQDNKLLFRVEQNFNAEYEVQQDRVKADYVLKQQITNSNQQITTNVPVLTFRLKHNFRSPRLSSGEAGATEENEGVYWKQESGDTNGIPGDIIFYGENGAEVFRMPVPEITDAAGKTVEGELIYDQKTGLITLTIPREFLETAQYPITIDPTVVTTSANTRALNNSGGRKLVADRFGNLIAVALTAANTLTAIGSADGGMTWPFTATISVAAKTSGGFSIDMDSASSVVHVVYANSDDDSASYSQVYLRYNGSNQIDALSASTAVLIHDLAAQEAVWNTVV
ncbi:MAG: hypothetical protein Q7S09_05585, partial [bacterium]|nr:hypothetical protein [bacterium]